MSGEHKCPHCNTPLAEKGGLEDLCPRCLLLLALGARPGEKQIIGNYEILSELGRGGMGIVYKAYQPSLNRMVALKVITGMMANHPVLIQRFKREAMATAQMNHPNIVTIYDIGNDGDRYFLAMEYVRGQTLDALIRDRGQLPVQDALQIILQVCRALGETHERGILHRDIKPQNILINDAGCVKVTDFGLAKMISEELTALTSAGSVIGTPYYMSPEQAAGKAVDQRSDIYSAGVVLYQMLTGRVPFPGDTPLVIINNILKMPVPPVREYNRDVPDVVVNILDRALAKDLDKRYQSVAQMEFDIDLYFAPVSVTRIQSPAPPLKKKDGRNKTRIILISLLSGLVMLIVAGLIYMLNPGTSPAPRDTPLQPERPLPVTMPQQTQLPTPEPTPRLTLTPTPGPATTGLIKDPRLDAALRNTLSIPPERPIQGADLQSLDILDIPNLGIASLSGLEHAANLEVLNVSGNPIGDKDLDIIARFPLMHNLMITECPEITDEGMLRLRGLNRVHILWLSYLKIQGPGLDIVRNMRELKQVYVNFTRITDEWLEPVADLPDLDILMIRGAPRLTDASLRIISRSRSILHLSAGQINGITDAGMAELPRMRQLQSLEIYRLDNVTVKGYQALKACPSLEEIQIGDTLQVNDDVILALAEYPALRVLQIQGKTSLSPAALQHVTKLSRLKLLVLPEGSCNPGEIEQLKRDMPGCSIKFLPPQYTWPHILEEGVKTW